MSSHRKAALHALTRQNLRSNGAWKKEEGRETTQSVKNQDETVVSTTKIVISVRALGSNMLAWLGCGLRRFADRAFGSKASSDNMIV